MPLLDTPKACSEIPQVFTEFPYLGIQRPLYSGIRQAGGKETKEFFKKKINNNNKIRPGSNVELYMCRT